MYTMCKQITTRWLFCNKVETCWWKSDRYKKKKNTHERQRDVREKVQEITFNYFARPQPRDLNFYVMMMMAIQKILLSVVSKFVVGVWDGLDACEISRPEILSQSAPAWPHKCLHKMDINPIFNSRAIFQFNEVQVKEIKSAAFY